ncbi:MAG: hypothetical protein KBB88_02295 [Candidatus Pacebacteria bacterium]|nr:hypothetical protein [Candidatus Paceibacterota bacterium]
MNTINKIIYLFSISALCFFFGTNQKAFAAEATLTMDNPAVMEAGTSGTYYIKGTYVDNTPATPLPEDYRLRAVYSTFSGDDFSKDATTSPHDAVFSPIPGYDTSNTGKFTITLSGLNPENIPSLTYYYQIVDNDSTLLKSGEFLATYTTKAVEVADSGSSVSSTSGTSYTLLAPLPIKGAESGTISIGSNDGPNGPNFDFGDYINGLLTFAIGIAGALAVVMIVVGGIQYMSTDNFGEKMEGKGRIMNAVGGMLLLIGAYMILNTLNPNLIDFNFKINQVTIEADPILDASTAPEKKADGTYSSALCTGYIDGATWPTDIPTLRNNIENTPGEALPGLGIDVRSSFGTGEEGYCKNVGDPKCTTVYYTPATATRLNGDLAQLKQNCVGCSLVITGGSECWLHKTHGPEASVVDMSVDSGLTKYLTGSTSFPSTCSWRNLPPPYSKGQALSEGPTCSWKPASHWHINFDKPFL